MKTLLIQKIVAKKLAQKSLHAMCGRCHAFCNRG